MKVTGTIKLIEDTQEFDSGFIKRGFVVTTDEDYPQDLYMEFVKDKVSLLDDATVGDQVEVSINLRGREYQGKYFVNLTAWKMDITGGSSGSKPPKDSVEKVSETGDDLPF